MMNIIVQIPAFNEIKTLPSLIEKTHKILTQQARLGRFEILIIDDASTDGTQEYLNLIQKSYSEIVCIRHERQTGLGRVFRDGVEYAKRHKADILVNMDGDGQFNPHDIPFLINPIIDKKADVVLGSRFKDPKLIPEMPKEKLLGNQGFALLISLLSQQKFYDVSCGFRAFSKEAIEHLEPHATFTYTHESLLQCVHSKQRIKEIPLQIRGERQFGRSRMAHNLARYGFRALSIIVQTYFRHLTKALQQDRPH